MNDLVEKISSYNIFNYLLPGVIFSVLVTQYTQYTLLQDGILEGAFLYYFVGAVVSRIGSLFVEPILKRSRFITFGSYSDFVQASKVDAKIDVLSEMNNMYRTMCSLFICIAITYGYDLASRRIKFLDDNLPIVSVFSLFLVFLLSYRKQNSYINKRVSANLP